MKMESLKIVCLFLFILLELSGCAHTHRRYSMLEDRPPNFYVDVSKIPNIIPEKVTPSPYANPTSYVVLGKRYYVLKSAHGYNETGIASWYGMKFHQHRTSDGDIYNLGLMTGAHKTLPLPTYVEVTNLRNLKKTIVKINDRGPFVSGRLIDLSYAAAAKLGILQTGTAPVRVKALIVGVNYPPYKIGKSQELQKRANRAHDSNQKVFLQIATFTNLGNAHKLVKKVKRWTSIPVLLKTAYAQAPTYLVEVGPLNSPKEILKLQLHLQRLGIHKTFLKIHDS